MFCPWNSCLRVCLYATQSGSGNYTWECHLRDLNWPRNGSFWKWEYRVGRALVEAREARIRKLRQKCLVAEMFSRTWTLTSIWLAHSQTVYSIANTFFRLNGKALEIITSKLPSAFQISTAAWIFKNCSKCLCTIWKKAMLKISVCYFLSSGKSITIFFMFHFNRTLNQSLCSDLNRWLNFYTCSSLFALNNQLGTQTTIKTIRLPSNASHHVNSFIISFIEQKSVTSWMYPSNFWWKRVEIFILLRLPIWEYEFRCAFQPSLPFGKIAIKLKSFRLL